MRKTNLLKKRLREGKTVIGPWCVIPSSSVINIIASSGMDFVILDMEHGPLSSESIEDMIRSADSENCTPLVRVSERAESKILNALDSGAHGVIIPHIESKAAAEESVSYIKYHPEGRRGFSPYTRAGGYGTQGIEHYAGKANAETLVALILEGLNGINNLDEIIEVPNVDLIYIGAYDLSQALGMPGQVNHPEVKRHLERSVNKIRNHKIAAGGYVAKNIDDIKWMTDIGMQFITYLPDATVLHDAFHNIANQFIKIVKGEKTQ